MRKQNLSPGSRPDEFSEFFMPFPIHNTDGKKEMVSFVLLTKWTNVKANLTNAGPGGVYYHNFHSFSVQDIRQHIGLYVFHGLAPSPQIEKKFSP